MALILSIETATPTCSVALTDNEELIAYRESEIVNSHARVVTVFVQEILSEAVIKLNQVDAVAVSKGPGSYTGLRIGVSTAKGLCYAADKPLIAVNTLQSMAMGMIQRLESTTYNPFLIPMIDARRMEVYAAVYNRNAEQLRDTQADIVEQYTYDQYLKKEKVIFFGNGAAKCKGLISNMNAIFIDDFKPSAAHMRKIALQKLEQSLFEDVAYFEPFYLKDFVAGVPKVKGLKQV
ncbi:MAG: tRNA (adenosine(37)-N6)-threonylcarbamoyltransferase complex dimerization subunit type 1 TsaB [Bacteroidales bacterium]|nr:tRNA (adenosine(37)-N6)-threonylcarbamoyltransferase complex dimerization subunit type 1 TsaB [Bacteroidales bacterium]